MGILRHFLLILSFLPVFAFGQNSLVHRVQKFTTAFSTLGVSQLPINQLIFCVDSMKIYKLNVACTGSGTLGTVSNTAISATPSSTPTLSQVLASGNSTGANNIAAATGQGVTWANGVKSINTIWDDDGEAYWYTEAINSSTSTQGIIDASSDGTTSLFSITPSGSSFLENNNSYGLISSTVVGYQGYKYGADYSANYTARSLIDKGYAAATFAPISGGAYLPLTGGTLTGNLLFTDNLYDIGASGATRPRRLYAGTEVVSPLFTGALTGNVTGDVSGTSANVTGIVALANGGTNSTLAASNGSVVYSTASQYSFTPVGSSGQVLRSAGAAAPTWSTATYPATATGTGTILRADGTNWVATTATYPNTITSGYIPYATGTNVIGSSANFQHDGTTVFIGGNSSAINNEILSVQKDQNSATSFYVSNTTSGTDSRANFGLVTNGGKGFFINAFSSAFTTSGTSIAGTGSVFCDSPSGFNLGTIANTQLALYTNSTERARFNNSGEFGIGMTPVNIVDITKSSNAGHRVTIYNATSGTGALAGFSAKASAGTVINLQMLSAGYTTYGASVANDASIYTNSSTGLSIMVDAASTNIKFSVGGNTEKMRISAVGNVSIGGTATRATTVGTNSLQIFDGTAPVGTLANGCSFYSTAGEMRVMDAAGNATLLSPHEKVTNNWIYYSVNTQTGKVLKIDMEKMMKFLNDTFGTDFVHEYTLDVTPTKTTK